MARQAVSENPYREHAWCALMLALYRLGRQSEALEVAHDLRDVLADGLGLDPSPEARLLQEQILTQDPALDDRSHVRLNPAHPGLLEAGSEPRCASPQGVWDARTSPRRWSGWPGRRRVARGGSWWWTDRRAWASPRC